MKRALATTTLAALLALSSSAWAHDQWLLPDQLLLASPGDVSIKLVYGEQLAPEGEHPFEAKKLARLTLVASNWARELRSVGVEGQKPLIQTKLTQPGAYLVVADRTTQYLSLDATKFGEYLEEEGHAEAIAERIKRGEQTKPGRERYTRFLKTLVSVGDAGDSAARVVVGQRLEIILESDPRKVRVGDVLAARVLFEGKPLSGAAISGYARDELSSADLRAVTDGEGRATFRVTRAGTWLVRLVKMRRCDGCPDAEWESFWASYAFAVR